MIKHFVCFKLIENTPEDCQCAKEMLLSMKGNVPQLRDIHVYVDFLHSPRSYDILLEVLLDDAVALAAYQSDPYHCDVVKPFMHTVTSGSIALDCVPET